MFKKYSLIICGILLANLIFAQEQQEYKKFKGWKKAETEHFNFIFEEEFIPLGDDEYFKKRQNFNELLKLKSTLFPYPIEVPFLPI